MKLATWNVNGIRARMEQVVAWIADEKPDVLCLQEIKASPEQLGDSLFALSDYVNYWHGAKGGYSGVSLHFRRSTFASATSPVFAHPAFDTETRIVVGEAEGVRYASLYVPNGGKDYPAKVKFLSELVAWARETCASGQPLVISGDINIALADIDVHPKERRDEVIGQRREERALFEELLACGLVDVGRKMAPDDDRLFTWWPYWRQARERNIGWRIDYVLASRALADRVKEAGIRRAIGTSDHAPVVVTFG